MTLEELRDGTNTAFWRWFTLHYAQEWGESAFGLRVAEVFAKNPVEKAGPLIQQMTCARNEIGKLFAAVEEKRAQLSATEREKDAPKSPGRRPLGL